MTCSLHAKDKFVSVKDTSHQIALWSLVITCCWPLLAANLGRHDIEIFLCKAKRASYLD